MFPCSSGMAAVLFNAVGLAHHEERHLCVCDSLFGLDFKNSVMLAKYKQLYKLLSSTEIEMSVVMCLGRISKVTQWMYIFCCSPEC